MANCWTDCPKPYRSLFITDELWCTMTDLVLEPIEFNSGENDEKR